jgi:hypothetical protein
MFTDKNKSAVKLREKLAADGMQKFQRAQEYRTKQEQQWYLDLAFYFGQHYLRFINETGTSRYKLHVPKAPYYKVRPVINQVRKVVRKEISRLTSQQPNAYIIPASVEDRDIFAAQAGEQIWTHLWRHLKLNRTIRRAVFWQATTGTSFIKHWWNPAKRDTLNNVDGDIEVQAITPFHIFVEDLKQEEIEEQPCIIHAQVMHKEWVKQYFDVEISGKELEVVDESLLRVMGIDAGSQDNTVIVLEVWVKPGYLPELPEGGVFTIAANRILRGVEGWPYSHGQYPFSKLEGIPTGKFYSASIVEDLIPLNRELNRTRGQIIEAKNLMAKPQLRAEKGSIVTSKITSEPGLVIEYKMGYQRPEPMPMQNLPSYVTEEVSRLYTDIADLSGQHEVSQGQTPPGVTAAVAISYLQEQDESLIAPHYDSLEECIEKLGHHCLVYVKDYWQEERTIRTVGLDNSFDILAFRGSDLRGNTDIVVEAGSALPTSKAAKQAYIMDLMKMGFIPPEKGLEVLEIGGLNKIYEQVQVDARHAQRENLKMSKATKEDMIRVKQEWEQRPEIQRIDTATGQPLRVPLIIPTNSYDNHALHIEYHNRYRKSQAFEMATPEVKLLFEEHVREHMQAQVQGMSLDMPGNMPSPLQPPSDNGQVQQPEQMMPEGGGNELNESNAGNSSAELYAG